MIKVNYKKIPNYFIILQYYEKLISLLDIMKCFFFKFKTKTVMIKENVR